VARVLLQRDAELTALSRQLGQVCGGAGRVILVEGPAGIGKSSLLAELADSARSSGMRTLRAWASPLEQDAGWGIARQLFAPVRGGGEWDGLTVGAAALARRALDAHGDEPVRGGDAMHAATHGLTWLACGLAEHGPMLMIIDDIHWADAPSLRWLVGLTRQLGEVPLGIVCAVRSGEPPAEPDLVAELLAVAPETPVRPRPLGPSAVAALVTQRWPEAGAGFPPACHAATAGNPFLLGALLAHLAADGIEPTDEVAARLATFGPEQVARSVDRQLTRLPPGTADLARAFAVLGRDAPLRHAGDLADLPAAVATRLADGLRAAGLLDGEGDRHRLVHPLVASALYAGLAPGERALWHARAARLLDREQADPELVALHLLHTQPARDGGTVATLRTAAQRASRRGAPQSAAVFLRRALVEPPPDRAVRADVASELGLALAAHVAPEAPTLLAGAVDLAATPGQRARIALSAARALGLAGYFADAIEICNHALISPEGVEGAVRSRIEAELACNAWIDARTISAARDLIVARYPSTEAPQLWCVLEAFRGVADAAPVAEPLALLHSAFASGVLADEADSMISTPAKLMLILCGEPELAVDHCTELVELASPRGWLIALAHASLLRSLALVQLGRIRDAAADGRLAFEFKLSNSPAPALLWSLFPYLEALVEFDELDEAEAALRAAQMLGDPPAAAMGTPLLLERRARLRLAQHRPEQAHADLSAAADGWRRLGVSHPVLAAWRVPESEALVALDEMAEAHRVAEEHLALAERVGMPGPQAAGLRALARTVGAKESVDLLERGEALLAGTPERLEYARVLVDLGAALRRANRREAAREALHRALALTERAGMRLLARRARQELAATGARPRRAAVTGIDSLTSAEHRVAALAAQGLSNREIAQQLYVTRRTVETHLTHVFGKLGVSTRADLAGSLAGQ
jgi:DNA-binding CsgD family transcriptional regulator